MLPLKSSRPSYGPPQASNLPFSIRSAHPEIHSELETLRSRVPRYLLRGWSMISGGNHEYNKTNAIISGALLNKPKHRSAYDMPLGEFKTMANKHLRNDPSAPTEFSSWTANLNLAMLFAGKHTYTGFITILDTKHAGSERQIWYAPDLKFLGAPVFEGEYLVHRRIEGNCISSLSYRTFTEEGIMHTSIPVSLELLPAHEPITADFVVKCRRIGERYGAAFKLPVTLALLAHFRVQSRDNADSGQSIRHTRVVEKALSGLRPPGSWYKDDNIVQDLVPNLYWREVAIFTNYLRYYAEQQRRVAEEAQRRQLAAQQERERQEAAAVDELKLSQAKDRLKRQLAIEMNRNGMRENFGQYKSAIIELIHKERYELIQKIQNGEISMWELAAMAVRGLQAGQKDADIVMGGQ